MSITQKIGCALAAGLVAIASTSIAPSPARAQDITIVVNGQQVGFDQPPIERSGRVFVPLRGVFERLGASVVYDNGVINATGNGSNISLRIGSNVAIVNGSQEMLDVAPFLVGARTLVPLRFVSQALGANVDWNNNTSTVTIAMAGGPQPTSAPNYSVSITNMHPADSSVVSARRPSVSGTFSSPVDPNSVRISLDGRDVSSTTYVSATAFQFSPPYDLAPTTHTVHVTGKDANGNPFDRSWSFTSGTSGVQNYITNVSPTNGATVGGSFTVSGTTQPNSRVHIAAVSTTNMGGYFTVSTGSYNADVMADSYGHFSQAVTINAVSGGDIGVRLTSVEPTANAATTITLQYHG
ncbi:MAG TPA: stalk domain-containing protein [Candidatus Eremiobacteraceae bacterium]|nr:stalk domain-containing protein [Candidatus Eremiobacteraceae bacterium]